jgi:coenzyme F420 hydrogenase subunit beta
VRPAQGTESAFVDPALCEECASNLTLGQDEDAVGRGLEAESGEDSVGPVLETLWMTSGLWRVRARSRSGGVVTSLALHLLESGEVDGLVMPGREGPWGSSHYVARSAEEILGASGNRVGKTATIRIGGDHVSNLAIISSLRALDAQEPPGSRWGLVALPCETYSIARMRRLGFPVVERIRYVFGLLCFTNLPTQAVALHRLEQSSGIGLGSLSSVRFEDAVTVTNEQGESRALELEEALANAPANCRHCFDTSARYADISVGSVGAGTGFVTVLARTQPGLEALRRARDAGYLRTARDLYPDAPSDEETSRLVREAVGSLVERKASARR